MSDIPPFGILFELKDPLGRKVQLSANQWFGHILQRHPEMTILLDEVEVTIARPDFICTDAIDDLRICHYRQISRRTRPIIYVKVVVHRDEGHTLGQVITAYIASRSKAGEDVIYGHRIS